MKQTISMKRTMMAAVLGLTAFGTMAGTAAADMTYSVSLSVPDNSGTGTDSVTGTITVDKLGLLGPSDFTAYSLTFTAPSGATTLLTQANATVTFFNLLGQVPIVVDATANALTIPLPGSISSGTETFSIGANTSPGLPALLYSASNGGDSFNISYDRTQAGTRILSPGTYTIGTAAAAVPEPSSLILMGAGALMGLVHLGRKRLRANAA